MAAAASMKDTGKLRKYSRDYCTIPWLTTDERKSGWKKKMGQATKFWEAPQLSFWQFLDSVRRPEAVRIGLGAGMGPLDPV